MFGSRVGRVNMLNITYTVNPFLSQTLREIDSRRIRVLLAVVPPNRLRQISFSQWKRRLMYLERFGAMNLTEGAIRKVLTEQKGYPTGDPRQILFNYRSLLPSLAEEWTGNPSKVMVADLEEIFRRLSIKVSRRTLSMPMESAAAEQMLTYLQSQEEHPLITAALIGCQIVRSETGILSYAFAAACGYVFLYKSGYDCRNLLVFESAYLRDSRELTAALDEFRTSGNANAWILAVIQAVAREIEALDEEIMRSPPSGFRNREYLLSDRQLSILNLASAPGTLLTNRAVRKQFKISQITASRDLSKLASLGLLYAHGKGRDVKYSKI